MLYRQNLDIDISRWRWYRDRKFFTQSEFGGRELRVRVATCKTWRSEEKSSKIRKWSESFPQKSEEKRGVIISIPRVSTPTHPNEKLCLLGTWGVGGAVGYPPRYLYRVEYPPAPQTPQISRVCTPPMGIVTGRCEYPGYCYCEISGRKKIRKLFLTQKSR